jgi:hypothetical protein
MSGLFQEQFCERAVVTRIGISSRSGIAAAASGSTVVVATCCFGFGDGAVSASLLRSWPLC